MTHFLDQVLYGFAVGLGAGFGFALARGIIGLFQKGNGPA